MQYPVPGEEDHRDFRRIWNYWCSLSGDGRLPARRDIEPLHLRGLLGSINLLEVCHREGGDDFRFRLWGTRVADVYGRDHTGKELSEINIGRSLDEVRRVLSECARTGRPHFWRATARHADGEYSYRRLLLPLADDGRHVDGFLAYVVPDRFAYVDNVVRFPSLKRI